MTPMTESERATLELAPGSRWEGNKVRDLRGTVEVITETFEPTLLIRCRYLVDVQITDALALIRAAGLDPVWEAARKLVEAIDLRTDCFALDEERERHRVPPYVLLSSMASELEALRKLVKP